MPPSAVFANRSDEDLMDDYYAGNDEALAELQRRYHAELLAFLKKRVGDFHTAENLFQEVFRRITQTMKTGSGRFDRHQGTFRAWLYTIAWSVLNDHWRKLGRDPIQFLDEPLGDTANGDGDSRISKAPAMEPSSEDKAAARECQARMPEKFRIVVELRHSNGFSVEETAEILDISIGEVSKRDQRGLTWFRNCMLGHRLADC